MISFEQLQQQDIVVATLSYPDIQETAPSLIEDLVVSYENLILQKLAPLDAFINLASIYWQCIDPGFSVFFGQGFLQKAESRFSQVLAIAAEKWSEPPEIKFWQLYFEHITLGKPSFEDDCSELVVRDRCTLVPYFYLFVSTWGREYRGQATNLLIMCEETPTMKNCYIKSILTSGIIQPPLTVGRP
ncbi:MAG: hypothetical protein ACFCD0_16210 [Gemmataceae bacterium]